MIYRSKSPLRVSFAGGGTDVPPYPELYGGLVLCATINKYAYASLVPREDDELRIRSLDYNIDVRYRRDEDLFFNGELDLVKAVVRFMGSRRGADLFLHSDAPPGSGLGSSSAMVVALIGVLSNWLRNPLTNYQTAEQAVQIEREDLGIKGGLQDQYASAFGGFNLIEFNGPTVVVNPLRVERSCINELHYRLLLCYTGSTRLSANILARQIESYQRGEKEVLEALHSLKGITLSMKNALLHGRVDAFGELLGEEWQYKKRLDSAISTPAIDEMFEAARREGALGGKVLGAGGGGYLLLCCRFDRKHLVAKKLEEMGGEIVDFEFEREGLQTWSVREQGDNGP